MRTQQAKVYLSVRWHHTHPDEPVVLVSELDEKRMELRKIEYFKDGLVGIASRKRSTDRTFLGSEPVPSLEEINSNPEFSADEIVKDEFELQWNVYV